VAVESEVIRLMALYQPVGPDLRLLCTILKVNNDLERIADCAVNVAERAQHLDPDFVERQQLDIRQLVTVVRGALRKAIQAYASEDAQGANEVLAQDDAVDALYAQSIRTVIPDAATFPDDVPGYLDLLSIAKNLERIADHATNIAEDVIYLTTGEIVRHGRGLEESPER
jgi:phosphate transport system protein